MIERKKLLRMHNVEWNYYKKLAISETSLPKSAYLHLEAWQLKRFEKVLEHASVTFAISPSEHQYLNTHFSNVTYLPAFHAHTQLKSPLGRGTYALYHGNLAVNENHQAALFLVNKVFVNNSLNYPLIIAGKAPKKKLREQITQQAWITLKTNPTDEEMNTLIANAHVHVLPTFQNTGIKLKLLNALFQGRFCLVNDDMVQNTGLAPLCYLANDVLSFRQQLQHLSTKKFEQTDYEKRHKILLKHFSNSANAKKILSFI